MQHSSRTLCALLFIIVGSIAPAGAQELGSTDYKPSPDHPIGWRGDGTGRFPAATPPTTWGRTIKGVYSELRCQAGKHAGDAPAGELLNMGFVRDWVIAGPFDAKDFKTGIDEDILKDEATLQPAPGEKAGTSEWKAWHVNVSNQTQSAGKLLVDFAQSYDKDAQQERQNVPGKMEPWAAYAQTALWSPQEITVRMRIEGTSTRKAWLNGAPVKANLGQYEPTPEVTLKKGWNNLVIKAVSTKGAWNFVVHVAPKGPYEYETKNIQWMTRMPGQSWCSPIIVGDKIFVSADGSTLVCLNKADGKVLWMRSTTFYHAVDAEEQAKFADLAAKVQQLDAACEELPAMINQAISRDGMAADHSELLNKKIKDKVDMEGAIQAAMAKADKKKYDMWANDADNSKYNPVSDGKYVWVVLWGGNKGIGANVVACFDLNGKRIWSYFCGQSNISEHGTHSSPALCGKYVIVKTGGMLFGFEKDSGKVAWQTKAGGSLGASVVPVRIGNEVLAYVPQCGIYNPSNGAQLWKADPAADIITPTINDGVIYGVGGNSYFALRLPGQVSDRMTLQPIVKTSWKELQYHMPGPFSDSLDGSPLFDKGLFYIVSEGGALNVIDAQSGKRVYAQELNTLNPRLTWVFVVGICSSASLGGNYIFVRDDGGQTLVLQPGQQYKEIAKNQLQELNNEGIQAESQSNFFFEGSRIYFRSRAFLYCIGEK